MRNLNQAMVDGTDGIGFCGRSAEVNSDSEVTCAWDVISFLLKIGLMPGFKGYQTHM